MFASIDKLPRKMTITAQSMPVGGQRATALTHALRESMENSQDPDMEEELSKCWSTLAAQTLRAILHERHKKDQPFDRLP